MSSRQRLRLFQVDTSMLGGVCVYLLHELYRICSVFIELMAR